MNSPSSRCTYSADHKYNIKWNMKSWSDTFTHTAQYIKAHFQDNYFLQLIITATMWKNYKFAWVVMVFWSFVMIIYRKFYINSYNYLLYLNQLIWRPYQVNIDKCYTEASRIDVHLDTNGNWPLARWINFIHCVNH